MPQLPALILVISILLGVGFAFMPNDVQPLQGQFFGANNSRCPFKFHASESNIRVALPTDSGMHALWVPSAFSQVCDGKSWELEVLMPTGLQRHIKAGNFVPLYVHSDGTPSIEIRVESDSSRASLSETERKWAVAESEDYLLVSDGVVNISGVEYIGGSYAPELRSISVPSGRWAVKIFLVDAPESVRSEDGLYPSDFLAIVRPEPPGHGPYRQTEETFEKLPW